MLKQPCVLRKGIPVILMLVLTGLSVHAQKLESLLEKVIHYEIQNKTDSLYQIYVEVGHLYMQDSIYGKAIDYYQNAFVLSSTTPPIINRQKKCHAYIGNAFLSWGKYAQAIEQYEALFKKYQNSGEIVKEKETLLQLSQLYKLDNNIEASFEYNKRLLTVSQELGDKAAEVNAYNNLGIIYEKQQELEEAEKNFTSALEYIKSAALPVQQQVLVWLNVGYYYARVQNYKKAEEYYLEADKLSQQNAYAVGVTSSQNALAALGYLQKKYDNAFESAHQALDTAEKYHIYTQSAEASYILSKLYETTGDVRQSQSYYKQYLEVQERMDLRQRGLEAVTMQRQLDAEKQENEVKLLISDKERQALELKQLKLESEKKARELELNRQQIQLLVQDKELQKQTLANQLLERQRIALEKEKIQQALLLAQKEIETNQQEQRIASLQKDKEIEALAKKEQEQQLALLQAESDLQEQNLKQEQSFKLFIGLLALMLVIVLAVTLIWLYQKQRSNRKLQKNEVMILQKNEELRASEEELRQNTEELMVVNEKLGDEKNRAENALQELKEAKNQMVQSEKMASLGLLTAGVAHEINNPVNFISGGVETLKLIMTDIAQILHLLELLEKSESEEEKAGILLKFKELDDDIGSKAELKEDAFAMLSDIETGVDRVTEIVLGLRNFSRSDGEQRMPDNLHNNINNTLVILHSKYGERIEIIKNFDESIKKINCYPGQMSQVFMNIIGNSIDAIEGKGSITIATKNLDSQVQISIKDTGIGIPKEVQAKIFDPFFTTKDVGEGTGLGLSIVHGIIEKHGGTIDVYSEKNDGTEFVINLPQ